MPFQGLDPKHDRKIDAGTFEKINAAVQVEANWVRLGSQFVHDRFLSDFIAAVPHHLEEGLLPYPSDKVREKVFADGSRSDVFLEDDEKTPVVVECKNWRAEQSERQSVDRVP